MRIGRTLSPAAAPISFSDVFAGIRAGFCGETAIEEFRNGMKDYFLTRYCFPVSSGKAALCLILRALQALNPDRNEVLVSALNCFSVPSAIRRAGLKIRLCDVDPQTLDFNFTQLETKLDNPKLLCVISTHLFGRPADVRRLHALISDPVVTLVEDAAQAFGTEAAGQKLGTIAVVGLFSLGRGKALSAVEGGLIVTDQEDLGTQLETMYRELPGYSLLGKFKLVCSAFVLACFQRPKFYWLPVALPFLKLGQSFFDPNFRMSRISAIQVGLLHDWPDKIRQFTQLRLRNALELVAVLDELTQPHYGKGFGRLSSLIRLPWRVDDKGQRDKILSQSQRVGLGCARNYPYSLDQLPQIQAEIQGDSCPVAAILAESLLTLPVHPYLRRQDLAKIKRMLHAICGPPLNGTRKNYKSLRVSAYPGSR